MNASKQKKMTDLFFEKISIFEIQRKKIDGPKTQEQLMINNFSINLILFGETKSIGKIFISLANLKIKFQFRN